MPAIRQRYRTTAETAIVGESLAGLFVVETLLERDLFDTYVAFDPSLWWNNGALVAQAEKRLQAYAGPTKTLYVAFSSDTERAPTTQRFATILKSVASPKLACYYQAMPEETHATIYHPATLRAFRIVFKPRKIAPTK